MREIKFRAWHKDWKMMMNVLSIDFAVDLVYVQPLGDSSGIEEVDMDDVKLMQYTNLKDRDGKEIYEGDILLKVYVNKMTKKDVRHYYKVEQKNGCFWARMLNGKGDTLLYFINDKITVIGNIYKNKELLEVKENEI